MLSPSVTAAVFDALRARPGEARAEHPGTVEDAGIFALTARERDVMSLAAQGLSRREVAERLVLSEKTVKNHITAIYSKLGASNRAEAVSAWLGLRGGASR